MCLVQGCGGFGQGLVKAHGFCMHCSRILQKLPPGMTSFESAPVPVQASFFHIAFWLEFAVTDDISLATNAICSPLCLPPAAADADGCGARGERLRAGACEEGAGDAGARTQNVMLSIDFTMEDKAHPDAMFGRFLHSPSKCLSGAPPAPPAPALPRAGAAAPRVGAAGGAGAGEAATMTTM